MIKGLESVSKTGKVYYQSSEITWLPDLTVNGWINSNITITDKYASLYPNAAKAKKLKEFKLYKALK